MAHGRRTVMDNGSATQKQRTSRGSRKVAALPLKFFNVKTSERFVFKRRDKRCLTLPPRSSLIPVFIHFSDFFPDLVQATLSKCKALILGCERVVILKPNQVWSVLCVRSLRAKGLYQIYYVFDALMKVTRSRNTCSSVIFIQSS